MDPPDLDARAAPEAVPRVRPEDLILKYREPLRQMDCMKRIGTCKLSFSPRDQVPPQMAMHLIQEPNLVHLVVLTLRARLRGVILYELTFLHSPPEGRSE